jgi:hypothetical protein
MKEKAYHNYYQQTECDYTFMRHSITTHSFLISPPQFSPSIQDCDDYPCNYGHSDDVENQIQHVNLLGEVFGCNDKPYRPGDGVTVMLGPDQNNVCNKPCQQGYYYSSYHRENHKFRFHEFSPALYEIYLVIKRLRLEQTVRKAEQSAMP